jgi:putative flavoprotein involved in K+ transport
MIRSLRDARLDRASRASTVESVDTLIIGAGQAGLALSYHLTAGEHDHVLLERGRVGQRWHERWDSLTLLSPNWMNGLPGAPAHQDQDAFLGRTDVLAYLEAYARSFGAPVAAGVEVELVERHHHGFRVDTSSGAWSARNVVLATGDAALPAVPFTTPAGVPSVHSSEYRRPDDLPQGRVLVVGAGASGQQIALELAEAGRDVVLAVGRHSRAPRRLRGRDVFSWLQLLGDFDRTIDELPDVEAAKRVPLFPLSGANGGEDLGLDRLAQHGVTVTGRLRGFDGMQAVFADDLAENLAAADARLRKLVRRIDEYTGARGSEPVRDLRLPSGPKALDLRTVGVVLWATGYRRAYPWLAVPNVVDERGDVAQRRGVTGAPGVYVLGLAYQYRRSSHFIGGVGRDAETLAARLTNSTAHARGPAVRAALR